MASPFKALPLVASPSYPNSVAWSKENLVAIASGHLITILTPALHAGPRGLVGLVTLPPNKPFPIGLVEKEDLLTSLMPTCLSRDTRPCARSISWSDPGFAPNSGCLLAVCTTEGRVKLYRPPYWEFYAEWVEVMDISDMLYDYLVSINFGELNAQYAKFPQEGISEGCITESVCAIELRNSVNSVTSKGPKWKKSRASSRINEDKEFLGEDLPCVANRDTFHEDTFQERNAGSAVEATKETVPTGTKVATNRSSIKQSSSVQVSGINSEDFMANNLHHKSSMRRCQGKLPERTKNGGVPLITAVQYASRNALLSSLIVAWSPVLQSSGDNPLNCFSNNCTVLAVGGKSGKISFWRIKEPQCYTSEHGRVSVDAMLIGLLQAHNTWITAISWSICSASASKSQLVLATGSSDGSVKIWLVDAEGLIMSSEVNVALFSLLKEVIAVTHVPISIISLAAPVRSLDKIVLAIGKGSGSLEAWIGYISSNKFQSAGAYDVHDQVVTGLAWAFDGCCLYSCSQDESFRSWVLHGSALYEVPFPSNSPGFKSSTSFPQVSDPCFGLALSPGDLVVAVARSYDANLLDQMYQARTQKAGVEFFWTGSQSLAIPSDKNLDYNIEVFSSERDLMCWESNILWSLKQYENVEKLLVLWDSIEALLAFKKSAPSFVERVLFKWLSSWFLGFLPDACIEKILFQALSSLSKICTRKLHLFNIICRRLMLIEGNADTPKEKQHTFDGISDDEKEQLNLWNKLLVSSEREIQERLVAFTFKAILCRASCSATVFLVGTNWIPVGVAQMERWVAINHELVDDQLKLLGSKIKKLGSRLHSLCEYITEETCSFCSASVPFESPEIANCKGSKCNGFSRSHRLTRCSVSMQLCPITAPMWLCMCCQRLAAKLAPQTFLTMSTSPLDVNYVAESSIVHERLKPFCPFCGILLQRSSPV